MLAGGGQVRFLAGKEVPVMVTIVQSTGFLPKSVRAIVSDSALPRYVVGVAIALLMSAPLAAPDGPPTRCSTIRPLGQRNAASAA